MVCNGKFHLGPPIHDVMSHEFGHELGLGHDGFQPHNCPIYNSIMNYTYIVGAGHRLDLAAYSEGALSSLVLNERHLSERLPFPLRKVEFLAMTPFQYRLAPSRDGRSTLIDWNWNGVLGEENVVADINYDHGTDIGSQHDVGRADAAPVLVTHGVPKNGRLLLFLPRGGGLHLREWLGTDVDKDGARWSPEIVVEPAGVVGDPTAAYARGADVGRVPDGRSRRHAPDRSGRRPSHDRAGDRRPWWGRRADPGVLRRARWRCFCGGRPTVRSAFG